ncbi:hypothetical protein JNW88_23530 [Micromonospora sp. ATA32]|nr:hypothetical protein [Micromonospora sp. ATA32]
MTALAAVRQPGDRARAVADKLRRAAEAFRQDPPRSSWLPHWKQHEKAAFADSLNRRAREIEAQP